MTILLKKIAFILAVCLTIVITGCDDKNKSKIHLILLQDNSESVTNDRELSRNFLRNCIDTSKIISFYDVMSLMAVNGNSPIAIDAQQAAPKKIKQFCNQTAQNAPEGTYVCDRLNLSIDLINRSQHIPLLISQVQVAEKDRSCPQTWLKLSNLVEERGGKMVILNSSNDAGNKYNQELWSLFNQKDSVKFCSDSRCLKTIAQQIRQSNSIRTASEQ